MRISTCLLAALLTAGLATGCATDLKYFKSTDYHPNGQIRRQVRWTPFEYEIDEFYADGIRSREVYGTRDKLIKKTFLLDGSLEREEHSSPNLEIRSIPENHQIMP